MSVVLYVGGSKDGDKGVVPYGFKKARTMTQHGPEFYVERIVQLARLGSVRVMALKTLHEQSLIELTQSHYARRAIARLSRGGNAAASPT